MRLQELGGWEVSHRSSKENHELAVVGMNLYLNN